MTRSDSRAKADPLKKDTLSLGAGNTMSRTEDLSDEDPRTIARALLSTYGWDADQFGCLDSLWERESHWNPSRRQPELLGLRHPAGAARLQDGLGRRRLGATNPVTQIKWGLGYIQDRYGSPCGAWGHSQSHGFY